MEEHPVGSEASGSAPDVLLGVTGGIAAYRACELVRLLVRRGLAVQVVMTAAALRFVGETTFAGLSRRPVLRDRDDVGTPIYPHLDAARVARVICVAPCSANTLARLALGLADSVLLESCLASTAPLVVAPAMNVRMWEHPATQGHAATLRARGAILVGPEHGELAEGERGAGRLAAPEAIAAAVLIALGGGAPRTSSPLAGRRVLVTAGGTREPLDAVRYLGNRSSGRMGVALADEALRRGAEVTTLLAASVVWPAGGEVIETATAAALEVAAVDRAAGADVVLMAAAVADYRPAAALEHKRRRSGAWTLELEPTPDVLARIGAARRNGQVLVGFAAESGLDVDRARRKRVDKGVDLIVLNDISRADIGFDVDQNEVTLISADGVRTLAKGSKADVARGILDAVEAILPP